MQLRWEKPRGFETTVDRFTIHWEATVCSSGSGENGDATIYGTVSNDINTPYRQKGATTHGVAFDLFDLSCDCTYQVWVKPVYRTLWGPQSATMQINLQQALLVLGMLVIASMTSVPFLRHLCGACLLHILFVSFCSCFCNTCCSSLSSRLLILQVCSISFCVLSISC